MATLEELAARCEAATGPDRELDGALDKLLHKRPAHGDYDCVEKAIWRVEDAWSGILIRGDGFARDSFCAREYTASIDAAIALVPEGHTWCIPGFTRPRWDARIIRDDGLVCQPLSQPCATPALALCAAALKARLLSQGAV